MDDLKDKEIKRLNDLLIQAANWPVPPTPYPAYAVMTPEDKKAFEAGWKEAWQHYRITLKRFVFPSKGG